MQTYQMSGRLFADMMRGGTANLKKNINIVNDLNVFPIPDGDTGDNMCMTAQGGVAAIENADALDDTAKRLARGMLLSARGNSGVILSQFFEGLSKGFDGVKSAGAGQVGAAFKRGVEQAYSSVVTPTEGTILTVMREATDHAVDKTADDASIEEFFDAFKPKMRSSLEHTPELLPVLKEAGVIDSGGAGFFYIIEGMDAVLRGEEIEYSEDFSSMGKAPLDTSSFDENTVLEFGYCTELLIQLQNSKVDAKNFDESIITRYLQEIGNSIVCFKTGTIVKLHVHTMTPYKVLEFCQRFGEFLTIKIENMMLQHNESVVENNFEASESREFGVVAVAAGEGIKDMFRELGADEIVDGQQTMNPSAEDFIAAFKRLNAKKMIVLPNNSNIILAARQAAQMYEESEIAVLETRSISEGYSALTMLNYTGDLTAAAAEMQAAADNVITGLVTYAVRDSAIDGAHVKKGDYIGLCGKHILADSADKMGAACELLKNVDMGEREIILAIYGADVTADEKQRLAADVARMFPKKEFYEYDGKQDIYSVIFAIE